MIDLISNSFEYLRYSPVTSLLISISLLYLSILSTTISSYQSLLRYARLLMAMPGLMACLALSFPLGITPILGPTIYVRLAILGGWGSLRFFDTNIVGFWEGEEELSRWVVLAEDGSRPKKLDHESKNHHSGNHATSRGKEQLRYKRPILPIPDTMRGRLLYSLDLILTIRGTSMMKNRAYKWASAEVFEFDPNMSKKDFVESKLKNLALDYLIIDLSDTITKTRPWNSSYPNNSPSPCHPITTLPVHRQLVQSVAICVYLFMAVEMGQEILAVIAVSVFGSHPSSWPPLFNSPFSSRSLTDFWSKRWHTSLKRWFTRCAEPVTWIFPRRGPTQRRSRWANFARAVVVFALSMGYHIIMPMSLPLISPISTNPHELHHAQEFSRDLLLHRPVVQWSLVKFFLAQPFGMLMEYAIVFPLTKMLGEGYQTLIRRAFFWSWMLWTGRWFSDGWICGGVADLALMPLPFSFVRGIIYGDWLI